MHKETKLARKDLPGPLKSVGAVGTSIILGISLYGLVVMTTVLISIAKSGERQVAAEAEVRQEQTEPYYPVVSIEQRMEATLEERREKILDAIWELESGMRHSVRAGDDGRALGPYQIHEAYWEDAAEFDKSLSAFTYGDCSDAFFARRVTAAYLRRWVPEAWENADAEVLLRTHNGGPRGATKQATLSYWEKGRKVLRR